MKTKIVIRPARFLDLPGMIRVNVECLPENYDRAFWDAQFYQGKEHSFVAMHGNEVIGYLLCNGRLIVSLAILAPYRRHGIARQLLHHCLNSNSTKQEPLELHVRTGNEGAIALYKSLGFQIHETLLQYYHTPVEDAYHMRLLVKKSSFEEKKKMNIQLLSSSLLEKKTDREDTLF